MVTEVVPEDELEKTVSGWADRLSKTPTVATGLAKQLIDSAHRRTFAEQLSEEQRAGKICAKTADHAEGLAAANERRTPNFLGR
jgi:2-(1,2-epoxy-1,2-dihydrophenyl)acetyl-CoA isomerase